MSNYPGGYFVAAACWLLLLAPSPATAGFYKCVDESGTTSYSQSPCPVASESRSINTIAGARSRMDCRIAERFISRAARAMKSGQDSARVFGRYGGIDSVSPSAIGMINYVYTFKSNPTVNAARVTALATRRCESGSFGPMSCDVFPTPFIDELGGCVAAATGTNAFAVEGQARTPEFDESDLVGTGGSENAAASELLNQVPSFADAPAAAQADVSADCRARIERRIDEVLTRMRQASTAEQQDRLSEERRALGNSLRRC